MSSNSVNVKHPVDEIPRMDKLFPLGLQHVLAMYAGAIAVPLIVGSALGYSSADIAFLISADLFVAGVATLIQSIGFWRFGVRLPLMQGVTFAAVGPMIAIGNQYDITAIFGATIACGLFMIALAPVFSSILRFFPPLVTGTVIMIIGLSLMGVAAGWITNNEASAEPRDLGFAAGTLIFIILLERFAPPAVARVSVLLGLVVGTIVALPFGMVDWSGVGEAGWFAVITPLHFGIPTFPIAAVISMLVVGLVIMTETTGDMIAVGEIVDRPVGKRQLADGLRADGLSTMLGGFFNTFPYTAFAQNVGLVSLTRVKSRWVTAMSGVILIALGLVPKVAAIVEGVPRAVLGGAGIALFGMVVAAGVRTLARVHFTNTNVLVVAIAVGVALLPTVQPEIYANFPDWFQLIFHSGISAGALAAILLNLLLNRDQMRQDHAAAVQETRRIPKSLSRPDEVRRAEAASEGDGRVERVVVEGDPGR